MDNTYSAHVLYLVSLLFKLYGRKFCQIFSHGLPFCKIILCKLHQTTIDLERGHIKYQKNINQTKNHKIFRVLVIFIENKRYSNEPYFLD